MEDILNQGLELAVFGMATVFSFLTLLILATRVMSIFVSSVENGENLTPIKKLDPTHDSRLVAIISAAIRQHVDKK